MGECECEGERLLENLGYMKKEFGGKERMGRKNVSLNRKKFIGKKNQEINKKREQLKKSTIFKIRADSQSLSHQVCV